VHPGLQEKVLPLLAAADQWTSDAIVATLVNELAARPAELTIVLDDYHAIESEAIHKSLGVLLEHLPAGTQVVIAGRSDPPVPLARMRARGQVAELRADDLRFTTDEAAALLGKVWGLQLSDESIAVLTNRTEGWVTGFQLAALSLRDRADAAEFIRGFSGSHRFVLDYLTEEVLEHQPDRVRRFLVDTSILERLTGSLSDAVTGGSDGQEMLEDLERANIFLVALDEERRWYRYHGLFADLLRARLQAESPERVAELHQKAAGWYEANGLIREAVRHALAAGEPARAAELVERNVDDVLGRGEGASLRRWLSALPHDVVRSRPRLAVVQALAAFNAGRLEAVEPLLNDAEHALTQPGVSYDRAVDPQSALANVPALIANLRSSLAIAQGDAERARSYAAKALVLSAGEHGPALSVRWNMTTADWLEGRMADAERAFSEIVAEGKATGIPHLTLSAGAFLGRVLQAEGRLGAAWRIYEEGLDAAMRAGRPVIPTAGSAHIGMAEVLYQRDRLDEALHHVNEGITLSRQLTSTQPLASGLSMLAWIRQAKGDTLGALQAMEEARRAYPNADMVSLINPVPAEMARLMIAHNDLRGAAAWLDERGVDEKDEPTYPREREYLVLARLLLAREFPGRALDLLAGPGPYRQRDRGESAPGARPPRGWGPAGSPRDADRSPCARAAGGFRPGLRRRWTGHGFATFEHRRCGQERTAHCRSGRCHLSRALASRSPIRGDGGPTSEEGIGPTCRDADRSRVRDFTDARRRQTEPGDRQRTVRDARYRQEAPDPYLRQTRRGEPDSGRRPRPTARADRLKIPPCLPPSRDVLT